MIFVCTYNEAGTIHSLLNRICDELQKQISNASMQIDIVVIDDSSPDGTAINVAHAIKNVVNPVGAIELVSRPSKSGLGSAIRQALSMAVERELDFALNLDADFSHDPREIRPLINKLVVSPGTDLVIGSRYISGGKLENCNWKRKLASGFANALARLLLRWKIRDASSAYRCYRVSALRSIPLQTIRCTGYGFLEEILWHILNQSQDRKHSVVELPITYTERTEGVSKISISEAIGTLGVLIRLACKSPHRVSQ